MIVAGFLQSFNDEWTKAGQSRKARKQAAERLLDNITGSPWGNVDRHPTSAKQWVGQAR
jgi:hypothetical protein